jgi:hypothetical protein
MNRREVSAAAEALRMLRLRHLYREGLREEYTLQPRKFDFWVEGCMAEIDGIEVDRLLRSCRKPK